MLKYLIQTVQTLFIPSVLLSMLYPILIENEDNAENKKCFFIFCLTALCAVLIFTILKRNTNLINREFFNLAVSSIYIVSALTFIFTKFVFLQKAIFNKERFNKTAVISGCVFATALIISCLPDIFLYPFEFAMSQESAISTDVLFKSAGLSLGLIIILISFFSLMELNFNIPLKILKNIFTACITLSIINHIVFILQTLLARRIIVSRSLFHFLIPIINHKVYFIYLGMLIAFLSAAIYWKSSFKVLQTFENPALARKAKAKIRNLRRLVFITAASFIFSILILSVVKKYNEREVELSPAEAMIIESDNIIIPIANIDDGHLHRFAYAASDGTEVRFIIVKKNASAYGVGLDACDICGQTGYYERSDGIICKRCDVVMNIMTIGFKGGCNPVPLSYSRADGKMIIKTIDLEKEKIRFQ